MNGVWWKVLQCFLGGGHAASACVFWRPYCSTGLYVGWPEPAETGLRQMEGWQEQYCLCAPLRDRDSPGYSMAALHGSATGYQGTEPAAAAATAAARCWLHVGVLFSTTHSRGGAGRYGKGRGQRDVTGCESVNQEPRASTHARAHTHARTDTQTHTHTTRCARISYSP